MKNRKIRVGQDQPTGKCKEEEGPHFRQVEKSES